MRPRTELGLSAGFLLALGMIVVALASSRGRPDVDDARRSTYLTGPGGASAFAGAAARLGVEVERYRRPTGTLELDADDEGKAVVAVLGPGRALGSADARHLQALAADLLLAGPGAEHLPAPRVAAVLTAHGSRQVLDSGATVDGRSVQCEVPQPSRVDTVLESLREQPVVLRLSYPGGRQATLVADDGLFRNRTLRQTLAGGLVLGLVAGRYRRMIVDEYHHGYSAAGSLGGAALGWSIRSPWGWMVWQLAVVGLIALVASGIRFGPVRSVIERRRRSPMEHVRALATALAAARGHDVAVRLMVQGLRRRLSRGGRPGSADLGTWLESLAPSIRTERGHEALATLSRTLRTSSDAAAVLAAGNAVETLWEELKPT